MHPIGQQNDEHLPVGIDPERGPRESGVAEGALRHVLAAPRPTVAGVPSQGTMASRPLGEQRHRRIGHHPHAVVHAAVEQHLGEHRQVLGRAEQPRMPGHAPKRVGVLVVDLATQRVATGGGDFGRGDPHRRHRLGSEMRVRHAQLGEHAPREERIERLAAGGLRDEAQQVGTKIGILVAATRRALDWRGQHGRPRLGRGLRDPPEFTSSREAGTVREQMTHRDQVAQPAGEVGKVPRHRGVEVHPARVIQHHDGGRGCHHLRERRQIIDALAGRDRHAPRPIERAEAAGPDRVALPANHHGGTRIPARIDPALDHPIDRGQARRRHADRRRLPFGEPAGGRHVGGSNHECGEQ